MGLTVAVDIGGTFTDLLGVDEASGRLVSAKSSTTPGDLAKGIGDCLAKVPLAPGGIDAFVHGSTVAINAVVERKGAPTALVVTRGTRDVYRIGRGNRPDAYDIWFRRPQPLVPRRLTFEIDERLDATGAVRTAFDPSRARAVADQIARAGVSAVAICFLHSWANPAHERAMRDLLASAVPEAFVTASHEILREYGEYERTSTTVLNAYIGPTVTAYLESLVRMLARDGFRGELLIMQSNGGVMAPSTARRLPVAMLESGPVGGFIAAARVGASLGFAQIIGFDMGGTTAKTNLARDGEPRMAHGYHIGGYASGQPMQLPVVDTVEIGSGGGSIARADAMGSLRVGPESAGALPGPACYGLGGDEPTVTDANLLLGRLDPDGFLGGEMRLDVEAARRAIRRHVADPLGLSEVDAALAIVDIAVLNMSLAVREVSVERGYDPRDFALVAFGGAGPLHAMEVARTLHIPTVVVPNFPGQFSAVGMLMADRRHDYVRTCYRSLDRADFGELARMVDGLVGDGRRQLADERVAPERAAFRAFLDVRYSGQDFSIPVPVDPGALGPGFGARLAEAFNALHQRQFGYHDAAQPLEIVNARVAAVASRGGWRLPAAASAPPGRPPARRPVVFAAGDGPIECPIYWREALSPGDTIDGPAIVQEYASTTLVAGGDRISVAASGELVIQVGGARR